MFILNCQPNRYFYRKLKLKTKFKIFRVTINNKLIWAHILF